MTISKYWLIPGVTALAGGLWAVLKGKPFPSVPPVTPIVPTGATKLTAYLANAFFVAVHAMAEHFRERGATITAEDLMEVFLAESGVGPHVPNSIGCLGLNQICPTKRGEPLSGLKAVGFQGSREEYLALPGEKQLVFVQRFFDNTNSGKSYPMIRDVGSLYLCNFSPAFLGKPDNFVMYRKGEHKAYDANAGVDTGNKGFIEVADMRKFVRRQSAGNPAKWNELRARLAAAQAVV